MAFTLPVALILVVALSTYLPSRFLKTDYNFVYLTCDDRDYDYYLCEKYIDLRYAVEGSTLVLKPVEPEFFDLDVYTIRNFAERFTVRIFLHDTQTNLSREITLEEAQGYTLNSLVTSPDGVAVDGRYSSGGGDFFFIFDLGSSSYGYYLTKGKQQSRLNLFGDDGSYYYQNNFKFLGWVTPEQN